MFEYPPDGVQIFRQCKRTIQKQSRSMMYKTHPSITDNMQIDSSISKIQSHHGIFCHLTYFKTIP